MTTFGQRRHSRSRARPRDTSWWHTQSGQQLAAICILSPVSFRIIMNQVSCRNKFYVMNVVLKWSDCFRGSTNKATAQPSPDYQRIQQPRPAQTSGETHLQLNVVLKWKKRPTLKLNRTKIYLDTSFVWVLPSKPRALAAQIKRIQPDSSSGKIMNWKRVRVGKSRDSDGKTDSDSFSIHFFSRWAIVLNPFDLGSLCTRLAWQNPDEAGV